MKIEYWITNNDMNIWKSIPDDHVADFHYMDDARDIWNAVKASSYSMERPILYVYLTFDSISASFTDVDTLEVDAHEVESFGWCYEDLTLELLEAKSFVLTSEDLSLSSQKTKSLDTDLESQEKFKIQQYLQNEHYALWEVIEFGDSYEAPKDGAATRSASDGKKGRTITVTTKDMQKRRNDVKARTTLLLALPDACLLGAIMGHFPKIICNLLSSGISFLQQGEPFFTSSGNFFWQLELITGSGNALRSHGCMPVLNLEVQHAYPTSFKLKASHQDLIPLVVLEIRIYYLRISAIFSVVAYLFFSRENLSSLAVGTSSGSWNSSLAVGMP
nr:hypothetical protein [Tanacetum cinerariifolium]